MEPVRITLVVAPRTKKTSQRIQFVGKRCASCHRGAFPKVRPSEAYEEYEARAAPALRRAWAGRAAIDVPVSIAALFYCDADRAVDVHALCQGLADVLVVAGILADDNKRVLRDWDGTRALVDRERPRVEMVISFVGQQPLDAAEEARCDPL